MSDVVLDNIVETTNPTDDKIYTHIVDRGNSPKTAETLVIEARIYGLKLTALCGHTWIPSRDPSRHEVCPKCWEMYEFARDFRGV